MIPRWQAQNKQGQNDRRPSSRESPIKLGLPDEMFGRNAAAARYVSLKMSSCPTKARILSHETHSFERFVC